MLLEIVDFSIVPHATDLNRIIIDSHAEAAFGKLNHVATDAAKGIEHIDLLNFFIL